MLKWFNKFMAFKINCISHRKYILLDFLNENLVESSLNEKIKFSNKKCLIQFFADCIVCGTSHWNILTKAVISTKLLLISDFNHYFILPAKRMLKYPFLALLYIFYNLFMIIMRLWHALCMHKYIRIGTHFSSLYSLIYEFNEKLFRSVLNEVCV